jgi:hypothetical protein
MLRGSEDQGFIFLQLNLTSSGDWYPAMSKLDQAHRPATRPTVLKFLSTAAGVGSVLSRESDLCQRTR